MVKIKLNGEKIDDEKGVLLAFFQAEVRGPMLRDTAGGHRDGLSSLLCSQGPRKCTASRPFRMLDQKRGRRPVRNRGVAPSTLYGPVRWHVYWLSADQGVPWK